MSELNESGYPLKSEWFAPHLEFRFPHYGTIHSRDIVLELRQAIEPWHVLGEEPGASGTVRYVDSSIERLQVLVDGMVEPRHVISCNGLRVPLHPTGINGQYVAGVRYRAWQPTELPAPDDPRQYAAGFRYRGSLVEPIRRWLPVSCFASGRPELRSLSG